MDTPTPRPRHDRKLWQIDFRHNGKSLSVYGRTREEALLKYEQRMLELDPSRFDEGSHRRIVRRARTVANLLDKWIADCEANDRRKTTIALYRRWRDYIAAAFGEQPPDRVTVESIRSMLSRYAEHPRTAKAVHQALHAAYKLGVEKGWCSTNPVALVRTPKYEKREKPVWSMEQTKTFLTKTEDSRWWPL